MKKDKYWMSALWGRLGASIIMIITAALQGRGVDISQDQMDTAYNVIANMIDNWYLVAGAVMTVVSKLREGKKVSVASQSGKASMSLLLILVLAFSVFIGAGLFGCAVNQSQCAAQQLLQKTSDPTIVLKGTFADAQDLYIEAQDTYKPWQKALQKANPALDKEIISYFGKADKILDDWELNGDVPVNDKDKFHEYIREISLQIALRLEEKLQE